MAAMILLALRLAHPVLHPFEGGALDCMLQGLEIYVMSGGGTMVRPLRRTAPSR